MRGPALASRHLTPEQWDQAVDRVLRRMGLDRRQVVVIAHRDTDKEHVHLVVNRVGDDGRAWELTADVTRAREAIRRIEKDYRLIRTGPRDLPMPHLTPGTYHEALRTGHQPLADRVREQAAGRVASALDASRNPAFPQRVVGPPGRWQPCVVTVSHPLPPPRGHGVIAKASAGHGTRCFRAEGEKAGMAAKRTSPYLAPSSEGLADAPEASAGPSGIHLLRRVDASRNPARLPALACGLVRDGQPAREARAPGGTLDEECPAHTPGAGARSGHEFFCLRAVGEKAGMITKLTSPSLAPSFEGLAEALGPCAKTEPHPPLSRRAEASRSLARLSRFLSRRRGRSRRSIWATDCRSFEP